MMRRQQMIKRKTDALYETCCDIQYLEKYRAFQLSENEPELRKQYEKEKARPKPNNVEIEKIARRIHEHNAIKKEMDDLQRLRQDLINYIGLLKVGDPYNFPKI